MLRTYFDSSTIFHNVLIEAIFNVPKTVYAILYNNVKNTIISFIDVSIEKQKSIWLKYSVNL